jgi:hypothetical protein
MHAWHYNKTEGRRSPSLSERVVPEDLLFHQKEDAGSLCGQDLKGGFIVRSNLVKLICRIRLADRLRVLNPVAYIPVELFIILIEWGSAARTRTFRMFRGCCSARVRWSASALWLASAPWWAGALASVD